MADDMMSSIAEYYRTRHELVLKLVDGLSDRQLNWKPNRTTPSIAFHVWHLARWADYLQELITGSGTQIWEQEQIAAQWGFGCADLGFAQTGLGMDDGVSDSLRFPGKDVLLDYTRRVFTQADQAVSAIRDSQFDSLVRDRHKLEAEEMTLGDAVLNWLVHAGRHLGMIECLLGVQGLHGTATR